MSTVDDPRGPRRYREFLTRYPALSESWDAIHRAGSEGPLDRRTQRLVKIAVSMGAQREGAVRAGVRKAMAEGIPREMVEQLVPLAAGTVGMPGAVACFAWISEAYERSEPARGPSAPTPTPE